MRKFIIAAIILSFTPLVIFAQGASALEKATIEVASKTGKSVVSISSTVKEKIGNQFYFGTPFGGSESDPFQEFFQEFFGNMPEREQKRFGLGSGVIIDKDGYILTNEHVVSGASEIKVKLSDGREYDAEVTGIDKRTDLAVIKIDAKNLPVAKLGDSDALRIGNWVVAVGNPFGFAIENPEPTVTVGVVSALHRYMPALGRRDRSYDDLIQTDAANHPGNSGGPLVNLQGEIIGINTAIITTSGGYQGLGFAIPINKAKRVLSKLIKGEKILYGWLGVNIQDLNEDLRKYFGIKEREGVIVLKVYKDSPADKGGLKEGDLILAFNNLSVKTTRDLVRMVSSSEVGEEVPIKIMRANKEKSLSIRIGKMPTDIEELEEAEAESGASFRGMSVEDLNDIYKRRFRIKGNKGVIVVGVEEDSPAGKSGIRAGDLILKIENKEVNSVKEFEKVTSKITGSCLVKTNRQYIVLKK